jgi:lipoprotein-releasing system permease protein
MYKLLLCLRYLRTRYIALASIISVMLGVATMIVVNAVMSGFAVEMQNRLHGIQADLVVDVRSLEGEPDADRHMQIIRQIAGDAIEGMTSTVVVPGMLRFTHGPNTFTYQVRVIGIDAKSQSLVSDFGRYLQHPENRKQMSFDLREGGYDLRDHQGGPESPERPQMQEGGWERRRWIAKEQEYLKKVQGDASADPASEGAGEESDRYVNPFLRRKEPQAEFDVAKQQRTGLVMGIALASRRMPTGTDRFMIVPGDDVQLTLPTIGTPTKIVSDSFTLVDFYESKMSEYDSSFIFVPIEKLQEIRGMIDPQTKVGRFTTIQIKLKPGYDNAEIRDRLRASDLLPAELFAVQTWQDTQGPLLAAVHMETSILNVLLFLIIAVSGFGILAIFFMIVVEKTRDIGILKSLGASGGGVMVIFLSYGLSLGIVGSGVGAVLGLVLVDHINQIADWLGRITGRPVFDPSIYYFYRIPTIKDPLTIAWIVGGAVGIAVLASVLPALRAAMLRPVEALRYE